MLAEVKLALRVTTTDFDTEIQSLIDAAVADLTLAGVAAEKAQSTTDPLIKRAVVTYCKAHFGYEEPAQAELFMKSYNALKSHLALSQEYTEVSGP